MKTRHQSCKTPSILQQHFFSFIWFFFPLQHQHVFLDDDGGVGGLWNGLKSEVGYGMEYGINQFFLLSFDWI